MVYLGLREAICKEQGVLTKEEAVASKAYPTLVLNGFHLNPKLPLVGYPWPVWRELLLGVSTSPFPEPMPSDAPSLASTRSCFTSKPLAIDGIPKSPWWEHVETRHEAAPVVHRVTGSSDSPATPGGTRKSLSRILQMGHDMS